VVYPIGMTKVWLCFMYKIAYNSLSFDQPKLILVLDFRPPVHVPDFSQIVAGICKLQWFLKCAKWQRKKWRNFWKICWVISWEWLDRSNLEMWPPYMDASSTVKFGVIWIRHHGATDVWKLWLYFPANILTPFACAPFSWVAWHTTVCLYMH